MSTEQDNTIGNCEELNMLIPAYVVDAVDPLERFQVERGLLDCDDVSAELESYQQMTDMLHWAVPQVAPSPGLRGKILMAAGAEQPFTVQQNRPTRWLQLLAAALVVVLIGTNAIWLMILPQRSEDADLGAVLTYLAQGRVNDIEMLTVDQLPAAKISWVATDDKSRWVVWFVSDELESLPAGLTYQLWLTRTEEVSLLAGEFLVPSEDGAVAYVFEIDEPIQSFNRVEVAVAPVQADAVQNRETVLWFEF